MATQHPQRIPDEDGRTDDRASAMSRATAETCYRLQVLARTLDGKAVSLSRQGRIGTYAPLRGHEAVQTATALALEPTDPLFPTYRDHAMYLARGVPVRDVLLHLMGHGNYVDRREPSELAIFPPTIPIATQLPHAVGAGMAADYRDDGAVALASFGDGATSEGDFHEALNFAGVFDAPVVFCCQNNGWAISTPTERQTAVPTLAEKAAAYGFEGVRVDGTDALAVYETVRSAVESARRGDGPTLIEATTYRHGAHTTTDDPSRYRDPDDLPGDRAADPVERTRRTLETRYGWSDEDERALREWAEESVESAVEAAEAHPGLDRDDAFTHVHADLPPRLAAQRDRLRNDA